MDILVFIKTDYHEDDCFTIINKALLEDLKYILKTCYYNGEIVLEVEYNKITNISLDDYDFFESKVENLCLGSDDNDFENPEKVKSSLKKLGKYYNIIPQYDFKTLI